MMTRKKDNAPSLSHDKPKSVKHEMNGKTTKTKTTTPHQLPVKNENVVAKVKALSLTSKPKTHVPPAALTTKNSSLGHGHGVEEKKKTIIKKPSKPPTTTPVVVLHPPPTRSTAKAGQDNESQSFFWSQSHNLNSNRKPSWLKKWRLMGRGGGI